MEVIFVTHNKGKIAYAQSKLKDINLKIYEYDINEPRSDDVKYISKFKVLEAYKLVIKYLIIKNKRLINLVYQKIVDFGLMN